MAVQINPKALGTDDDEIKINTVTQGKIQSILKNKSKLDKKFKEEELKREAEKVGLKYINLFGYHLATNSVQLIKREEAEDYKMGVFYRKNKMVGVLLTDTDVESRRPILQNLEDRGYKLDIFLGSEESLKKIINVYNIAISRFTIKDNLTLDSSDVSKYYDDEIDVETVKTFLKESENKSISDLFAYLMVSAYKLNTSDIHIEPEEVSTVIKFRLDGVLHEFGRLSPEINKKIENRIKFVSNLKINVNNVPQDGRFSFPIDGKGVDVRVSMLPSNFGYAIVMRLLGVGAINLILDDLGFYPYHKDILLQELKNPQGLILATGPTGSGKTTTLYSLLKHLNTGENKIITLEDPIEYKLAGISQTQIDKEAGYTFASGLRSILRQDPDIVMVGEIRDNDTAEVAVEASLTGHRVISTIHTNDSSGAIPRLLEMKVKAYALSSSISVIIGQRLGRRLCSHCVHVAKLEQEQKDFVLHNLTTMPEHFQEMIGEDLTFYTADGCDLCGGIGYKGRIGIYEVVTMNDEVRQALAEDNPSIPDIRKAIYQGTLTMQQDALIKALDGYIDIKEIRRVVNY